jgi:outer membrane protein assembly factor BamB
MGRGIWFIGLLLATACSPKLFLLPGESGDDWGQTGGGLEGKGFRGKELTPPLQLLWSQKLNGAPVSGALFAGDLLLQLTTAPTLYAFDRRSGERLGKQGFDLDACAPPALSGELLVLSLLGEDAELQALDRGTRKVSWRLRGKFCAPLAARGDTVWAAGEDERLRALDAASGEELWQMDIGGRLRTGVAVGGGMAFIGSGELLALDAASGEEVWRQPLESQARTRPAVGGGRVFVGTAAGRIVALDVESGAELWRAELGGLPTPGMALTERVLVVGAVDRGIYGLDLQSGEQLWRFATEGVVRSSPAVAGMTAYCGSSDGYFYALALDSGKMLWKYRLDGPVITPVSVGAEAISVTSEKGTVYVFGK